jgi:hypothetical protein
VLAAQLLFSLGWASRAHGHGRPPQVDGVAAIDDGIPQLVILNEGLALRGERGWSYLCPALWGDADAIQGGSPKAQSIDGETTWVIGDDVYAFDRQRFTPQAQQLVTELKTSALAGNASALFALRTGASGHEIVPVGTPVYQPIWSSSSYWTTLAADSQSLYVGHVPAGMRLDLTVLEPSGAERSSAQFALEIEATDLQLAPHGKGLFAVVESDSTKQLGKLEAGRFERLATAAHSILGPVASPNGSLWIAIDGRLQRLPGPGEAPAVGVDANCLDLANRPAEECVTCLGEQGGVAYACSSVEVYVLGDDGLGERVFDIHGLNPPPPELVTDQVRMLCDRQWMDFEQDLLANNLAPATGPSAMAGSGAAPLGIAGAPANASTDSAGCSTGGAPAHARSWPLALLLLCIGLSLRRSLGRRRVLASPPNRP